MNSSRRFIFQERSSVDETETNFQFVRPRPEQLSVEHGRSSQKESKDDMHHDGRIRGVYIISVAARILRMHPQTLRKYERLGLVQPSRTEGMLRLYSDEDLTKLRLIRYLEKNLGMNLAGVEFALNLVTNLLEMQRRINTKARIRAINVIFDSEIKNLFESLNLPMDPDREA
ncbi:MerR family transcriptional regulator [SAR202 cluster bacterium AD-804-J14_MRT_500m]|nr:MerR family transcriptional regulator [SAR202 cluster bacterium AD-804-J14_MRT_500m]